MLHGRAGRDCTCFPVDEPPQLELKAEIEAAKAVRCPLHGERFSKLAPTIYYSPDFITPEHLQPDNWLAWHSPQYHKALRASFPPDRWPATEVTECDGSLRFILKDGTEIHRTGPPQEVYDYQTGKLVGHVGPRGRFVRLPSMSS
jgi:hypothetical protein